MTIYLDAFFSKNQLLNKDQRKIKKSKFSIPRLPTIIKSVSFIFKGYLSFLNDKFIKDMLEQVESNISDPYTSWFKTWHSALINCIERLNHLPEFP